MSQANLPEPANSESASSIIEHDGNSEDGDEFEISNLPSHLTRPDISHRMRFPHLSHGGRYLLSARAWRGLIAAVALLVVFAVIFNMAYQASHPTSGFSYTPLTSQGGATTVSSIPTETINQRIGPIPTPPAAPVTLTAPPASCPPPLATPSTQPLLNETIGAGAVWVGSFTGKHATMTIIQKPLGGFLQYGWPVLVTVLVRSDFDHPVTITATDLSTGYTLWWSFPPADESPNSAPATSNTFTPQHPAPGTPIFWFTSYGTLFLPGAGCYLLQASWPNGGWKFVFAAGS